MANLKIDLEIGALKLSYDGPEEFVEKGLLSFIERVSLLDMPNMAVPTLDAENSLQSASTAQPIASEPKLSTTDFAVKLGVRSGTDLVMAAAAYLCITRGAEEFRRSELLAEMKTARSFYKSSYGGNLTKSLETLTKTNRLLNPRSDTYALTYGEVESIKMLL
ncbi:MAG: hypothetical protein ACU0CA_15245 [Paracoccaceae bacterium]